MKNTISTTGNKTMVESTKFLNLFLKALQKERGIKFVTVPTITPVVIPDNRIELGKSCYHYYRSFIKKLLRDNDISSAKFHRNNDNYDGSITIDKKDRSKALRLIKAYTKEQACVDIVW